MQTSFEKWVRRLEDRLKQPLPGIEAQKTMSPRVGQSVRSLSIEGKEGREAAVALLLFPLEDEPAIILTVRTQDLRSHPGQISLPGGSRDEGETLRETAVRELHEEVGVRHDAHDFVGALTPLYVPPSHHSVFPFVFAASRRPRFVAQQSEVEALMEIPLSMLTDPKNFRLETWEIRNEQVEVPFLQIGPAQVWGATAMILAEFLEAAPEYAEIKAVE